MSSARHDTDDCRDGRHLRRQRNIDAVRSTILDMLERGESPSLSVIAERSGVTIRSIYRYFDDLDHAVAASRAHRLEDLLHQWRSAPPIDTSLPFDERLDAFFQRRVWIEQLGRPLRADVLGEDIAELLDADVERTFAPEIGSLPPDGRRDATRAAALLLRPRSIRSMMEPGMDARAAQTAITIALEKLLHVDESGAELERLVEFEHAS